ncbi:MAG: pyridoxamine 5'-phosphate oxidase family protein [candidate division Zixibacteria bacterium]|nr:pyridoxamine 5'-phosphate oxidase family protein [candidate division Zixibacteria bacterium]
MGDFPAFKKYFEPKNNKTGYLATIARRGQPTLRPVSFFLVGRKICFSTYSGDAKVKQIKKNPHVEVCIPVNRGRWRGYYRIAGAAELVADPAARKTIFKKGPYAAEGYWEGADDPRLAIVVVKAEASRYLPPGKYKEVEVNL